MRREIAVIFVSSKRIGEKGEKGGIESMIRLLIRRLSSSNVHLSLVYRELFKLVGVIEEDKRNIVVEDVKEFGDSGTKHFFAPELIFLVVNLCFSFFAALSILSLVKNHRRKRYPIVIHAMDTVYEGLAASLASLLTGVPFVAHTHGVRAYFMHTTSKNSIAKTIDFLIEKAVTRFCSILISVNQQAHDFWLAQGISEDKIRVIPVPVNTKLYTPSEDARKKMRQVLHIDPQSIVFGYIGRLSSEKISRSLLDAFYRANVNSKLVIIGDGPLMPVLESYAKSKNIDEKVIFTGFIDDVNRVINVIDVLIVPSSVEGMSTVILEAFSNGKTVVASDISANREIIRDEIDGILFDPNNVQQLRDIIIRLSEDTVFRTRLATNSRKKASAYDVDKVLQEIFDAYENILGKQRKYVRTHSLTSIRRLAAGAPRLADPIKQAPTHTG